MDRECISCSTAIFLQIWKVLIHSLLAIRQTRSTTVGSERFLRVHDELQCAHTGAKSIKSFRNAQQSSWDDFDIIRLQQQGDVRMEFVSCF